jgi:hypothetical protein
MNFSYSRQLDDVDERDRVDRRLDVPAHVRATPQHEEQLQVLQTPFPSGAADIRNFPQSRSQSRQCCQEGKNKTLESSLWFGALSN